MPGTLVLSRVPAERLSMMNLFSFAFVNVEIIIGELYLANLPFEMNYAEIEISLQTW